MFGLPYQGDATYRLSRRTGLRVGVSTRKRPRIKFRPRRKVGRACAGRRTAAETAHLHLWITIRHRDRYQRGVIITRLERFHPVRLDSRACIRLAYFLIFYGKWYTNISILTINALNDVWRLPCNMCIHMWSISIILLIFSVDAMLWFSICFPSKTATTTKTWLFWNEARLNVAGDN